MKFSKFNRRVLLNMHVFFFGWKRFLMPSWWALVVGVAGISRRKLSGVQS